MKKDFISVEKCFKVLMCAGLISGVGSITSCNNDQGPAGTETVNMFPLIINDISITQNNANTLNDKSPQNKTYCYSTQSTHINNRETLFYSTDSAICFLGSSSWNYKPKFRCKNTPENKYFASSGNILRSSTANLKNKGIGIFRLSGTGYPAAQNNIHYAYNYDESDWGPSDKSNPVYLAKNEATLCAYYPYNTASTNGNVTLTSQLYSDDADLCYQTGKTASSESGDVSFTLNHAYAKITFIFKREESYKGNGAVSKISISGENILSSNILDVKTGIYDTGTPGKVTVNPGISSIPSGGTASAEVLLVPVEELTNKVTFTFTIDGIESMGVFSPSVEEFNKFEAGKNYTIKIDLTSNLVIVSGETANCYMLPLGSTMQIPVNVKGNGKQDAVAGTGIDVHHTAASVGILWETAINLVTLNNFNLSEQTVTVETNDLTTTGNVVIAAYSGPGCSGNILWSWHIWVTDYDPAVIPVKNGNIYTIDNTNGAYTWMDRNIGATTNTPATNTTLGLLYQWGRKDPFPGASNYTGITNGSYSSSTIYNKNGIALTEESETAGTGIKHSTSVATTNDKTLNLKNSIKSPMTFYCGLNLSNIGYDWYTATNDSQYQNDALWGGADNANPTEKTVFDPCPPGWRVPAWNGVSPWSAFKKDIFTWSDIHYGRTYNNETFYPATCFRNFNGSLYNISYGYCWSASASSDIQKYSYYMRFNSDYMYTSDSGNRALGFSLRCVKK